MVACEERYLQMLARSSFKNRLRIDTWKLIKSFQTIYAYLTHFLIFIYNKLSNISVNSIFTFITNLLIAFSYPVICTLSVRYSNSYQHLIGSSQQTWPQKNLSTVILAMFFLTVSTHDGSKVEVHSTRITRAILIHIKYCK